MSDGGASTVNSRGVIGTMLVMVFALVWITTSPFSALTSELDASADTGNVANQIAFIMVSALALTVATGMRWTLVASLPRPIHIFVLMWLVLSVLVSQDPALSAKRAIFTLLVTIIAASAATLPRSLSQLAFILGALSLFVLVLCYAGVLLIPEYSIHQIGDAIEPNLAGDWRGIFVHKNLTAAMMVIFIFIGLFVMRTIGAVMGWSIVLLAAGFLIGSGGKTAAGLIVPILATSWLCAKSRSRVLRPGIVIVSLVLLNLVTVGSVEFPAVKAVNQAVLPDTSFTGRTDVWKFALSHLGQRPVLGFGFGAFWATPAIRNGSDDNGIEGADFETTEARRASHAHNAYLDLALTIGLPGLALVLVWVVILPLVDMAYTGAAMRSPFALMMFRIWFFGLLYSSLESGLLSKENPVGFMFLFATFGLQLSRRYRPV